MDGRLFSDFAQISHFMLFLESSKKNAPTSQRIQEDHETEAKQKNMVCVLDTQ